MTHALLTTLLTLTLTSDPFVPKGSPGKPQSPPVQQPKPEPPPPPREDRPDHPRPRHDHSPYHQFPYTSQNLQDAPQAQDPALAIVERHMSELEDCYSRARDQSPHIQGEVAVEFNLGFDGWVTTTRVTSNSTNNEDLAGCITDKLKSWQFKDQGTAYTGRKSYSFRIQ